MNNIKIAAVDDLPEHLEELDRLLMPYFANEVSLVGTAVNFHDGVRLAQRQNPPIDLLVLDHFLNDAPIVTGLDLYKEIKPRFNGMVLIMSTESASFETWLQDPDVPREVIAGFIPKRIREKEFYGLFDNALQKVKAKKAKFMRVPIT